MSTAILKNREINGQRQLVRILFAYVILLVSLSVYGFWSAFVPLPAATMVLVQLGALAVLLGVAQFLKPMRPLRRYAFVALVVTGLTAWLMPALSSSAMWSGMFAASNPTFWQANAGGLLTKLVTIVLISGTLLLMGLQRRDFFLVKGQLDAPAAPVRWLGMRKAQPWTKFGSIFAILCFTIILGITLLPNLPRLGQGSLVAALPLLPAALLFAAVNGLYEEIVFRASFLSQLLAPVGRRHAFVLTILYFGLGHLSGSVPSGTVGVVAAAFFAFIMGKAMLETRGMTWPWICHFAADAAVFIFLAVLAVATPA